MADKKTLRRVFLARRSEIPVDQKTALNQQIVARILSYLSPEESDIIAGYFAIKGEPDVLPVLAALAARGLRVALPVVTEKEAPLGFRLWHAGAAMVQGFAGIPEPDPATCPLVAPTVFLVPLLGFDARCHRLGYGAGYYDRTFAAIKKQQDFTAIGIAYDMQKLEKVPVDAYDYPLDAVVTDRHIYTA